MLQIENPIILIVKNVHGQSWKEQVQWKHSFLPWKTKRQGTKEQRFLDFTQGASALGKAAGRTWGFESSVNSLPSLQSAFLCCWCWPTGVSWTQQPWKAPHRGLTTLGTETHLPGLTNIACVQLHLRWTVGCISPPRAPGTHAKAGEQQVAMMHDSLWIVRVWSLDNKYALNIL